MSHPTRRSLTTLCVAALTIGTVSLAQGTALAAEPSRHGHELTADPTPLAKGLYQSAYSERHDVLWTAAAVGRPPVQESTLAKVDPDTLDIIESYMPPILDEETGHVRAVYGVEVDDEHDTVWTTNTRDDSVSVWSQETGELLHVGEDVAHARELVVDHKRDLVWASSVTEGELVAFDSATFEEVERVSLEGARPAGLALNEATGAVYAADLEGGRLIEVNRPGSDGPRYYDTGAGAIGAAIAKNGRTAYTSNQTDGTVSAVNLRNGEVTTVPTGAGALSVEVDPRSGDVFVANRTAATLTVLDGRSLEVEQQLPTAAKPNHVQVAAGSAWLVDKAGDGPAEESNLYRIDLR